MNSLAKKVMIYSMVGIMQIGLGASVAAASPAPDYSPVPQRYGAPHHDRHDIERERHERERIENERHEREMRRRPNENRRDWEKRKKHENERHRKALDDIRHGRYDHRDWGWGPYGPR
ncbi:putative secreted protein [Propionispora sp. 2/2-37]|uniref:hypothetical protein n=1 Tax=Propionispora sp. 2/2-37 TaxID=1677858 RepID=UPI0006BB9844|nr:hypothetical protein [Propionispora sp. 2/2-37]CUH97826.1 putative secreted protein [Propionispora sp. 2/2-37]